MEPGTGNETVKILWDLCIQVNTQTEHRSIDIVIVERNTNRYSIIDVACPADNNLVLKSNEKLNLMIMLIMLAMPKPCDPRDQIASGGLR